MSIATQIANAIVDELKTFNFSFDFEPLMLMLPSYESADLETLRVTIVPRTLEIERVSRCSLKYIVGIDVGIQRRIDGTPEDTVITLGNLVDEIATFLKDATLSNFPSAQCVGITNDPLYVPEHLQQKRTFTSVLNVKYALFTTNNN
jgi:hypothetical protein